jgi:hypothetical protein
MACPKSQKVRKTTPKSAAATEVSQTKQKQRMRYIPGGDGRIERKSLGDEERGRERGRGSGRGRGGEGEREREREGGRGREAERRRREG